MRRLKVEGVTPTVYAVVTSFGDANHLHVGVYKNLDEAIVSAMEGAKQIFPQGAKGTIEAWATCDGESALEKLSVVEKDIPIRYKETNPYRKVEDCQKIITEARNNLMKHLLRKGDVKSIKDNESFLTPYGRRFLKEKLVKNKKQKS